MNTWAVRLAGALDILFGLAVVALNLLLVSAEAGREPGWGAHVAWAAIGGVLVLAGVAVWMRKGWGRALGIVIALVYIALCAAFAARSGLSLGGGREAAKLALVMGTGGAQVFVLLVLTFLWSRAREAAPSV